MRAKRGFTLIELLVVIAIIAILAAILFPVFAKAREKAQVIADISSLRQISQAIAMYQKDNADKYPYVLVKLPYPTSTIPAGFTEHPEIHTTSCLNQYVRNLKIFKCRKMTRVVAPSGDPQWVAADGSFAMKDGSLGYAIAPYSNFRYFLEEVAYAPNNGPSHVPQWTTTTLPEGYTCASPWPGYVDITKYYLKLGYCSMWDTYMKKNPPEDRVAMRHENGVGLVTDDNHLTTGIYLNGYSLVLYHTGRVKMVQGNYH